MSSVLFHFEPKQAPAHPLQQSGKKKKIKKKSIFIEQILSFMLIQQGLTDQT